MLNEPLSPTAARQLIRKLAAEGTVAFSFHATLRMKERGVTPFEIFDVLRSGVVDAPEQEGGTWRYPVRTPAMRVIVAFRMEDHLIVITLWRLL